MAKPAQLGLYAYWVLGLRNLGRNRYRTGLSLASIAVGIAALTFLGALNDGWIAQMRTNFILKMTGHVRVQTRNFHASQSLRDRIQDPSFVTEAVERTPRVVGWTYRVRSSGLAAAAGARASVEIMAVDPQREGTVTHLNDCVDHGRWLRVEDQRGILLGTTVADNLGLRLGDRVVLTAQRAGGEMASEVFYLLGVLCAGAPLLDRTLAVMRLATVQSWLDLDAGVTDVVLRAESHEAADVVHRHLVERLPAEQYQVLRWQDIDPMVDQWLRFSDAYSLVLILVVVALVVTGILNTMLMALHERMPELGLIGALGTRARHLFFMILLESVLLVMIGAIVGYTIGVAAVAYYADTGIDLSGFSGAFKFFYMSSVVRPVLTAETGLQIVGSTFVASLAVGLYPAWVAARVNPVDALRRM